MTRHRVLASLLVGGLLMASAGARLSSQAVSRARVRLLGIVDSDTDRTVASMAARGVSGAFGVDNELVVDTQG